MNMQQLTYSKTIKMTLSALFLATGVILPQLFHVFGGAGPVFLPMHIPVFLAGILVGPLSGLMVGLLSPTLSHLVSGMPIMALLPFMTIELVLYGLISGLLRKRLHPLFIVILAQLVGRCVYIVALFLLGAILQANVPAVTSVLIAASIGVPGITIQLLLIPVLIRLVKKGGTRL